jgi:hypothetical protein
MPRHATHLAPQVWRPNQPPNLRRIVAPSAGNQTHLKTMSSINIIEGIKNNPRLWISPLTLESIMIRQWGMWKKIGNKIWCKKTKLLLVGGKIYDIYYEISYIDDDDDKARSTCTNKSLSKPVITYETLALSRNQSIDIWKLESSPCPIVLR